MLNYMVHIHEQTLQWQLNPLC